MKNKYYNPDIFNDQQEIISAIRLSRTRNIGPATFLKSINKYGKPSDALRVTSEILKKKGEEIRSLADVENEIKQANKSGAKIITIFDEYYPALLAEISDPPIVLTVKGDYKKIGSNNAAIVGARYSSANSVTFTYKLAGDLTKENISVVSGLARGIDTAAHKGALKNAKGLSTIAVIAGGIDNIYPPENEELFAEIADQGVIITENEFGTIPKPEHFPRRNRIISGLSQVICVVEAALKSGSLITARMALEQGREVACVPGFPLDPRSEGTNMLLKKGANLVTCAADITELMKNYEKENFEYKPNFSENIFADFVPEENIQNSSSLIEILDNSPTSIDSLLEVSGLSAAELNVKLLEYEITGEIIRHPGNKVSKAA